MRMLSLLAPLASLALVAAPASTEMTLTSADGFTLKGTLTLPAGKGKAPVVILAHEFGSSRAGWAPLAERLAVRGIGTLALDLRGHGASTLRNGAEVRVSDDFTASAKTVGFDRIPADLAQAAAWLRKQSGVDGRRIGLAGSSVGAVSVLLAAPEVKPVAVLSLSPGSAFGKDTQERMKQGVLRAKASTLALASVGEKGDAAQNVQGLKDLPGVSIGLKEGEGHGFALLKDHVDLMAVFFGEYLTYHHAGKAYAAASAKPAGTPKNVINDQTLADRAKAEAPK